VRGRASCCQWWRGAGLQEREIGWGVSELLARLGDVFKCFVLCARSVVTLMRFQDGQAAV